MKIQLASFLAGAIAGMIFEALILGRKIDDLRRMVYWLSPPRTRLP